MSDAKKVNKGVGVKKFRSDEEFELIVKDGRLPKCLKGHLFVTMFGSGRIMRIDFDTNKANVVMKSAGTLSRQIREAPVDAPFSPFKKKSFGIHREVGFTQLIHSVLRISDNSLIINGDVGDRPWIVDPVTLEGVSPVGTLREWGNNFIPSWIFPNINRSGDGVWDNFTKEFFLFEYEPESNENGIDSSDGQPDAIDNGEIGADVTQFGRAGVGSMIESLNYASNLADVSFDSLSRSKSEGNYLVCWSSGRIRKWRILYEDGSPLKIERQSLVHEMALTKDFIFVLDGSLASILSKSVNLIKPGRLLIFDRSSLVEADTIEVKVIGLPIGLMRLIVLPSGVSNQFKVLSLENRYHAVQTLNNDDVRVDRNRYIHESDVGQFIQGACGSKIHIWNIDAKGATITEEKSYSTAEGMYTAQYVPIRNLSVAPGVDEFRHFWVFDHGFDPSLHVKRMEDRLREYGVEPLRPIVSRPSKLLKIDLYSGALSSQYVLPDGYRLTVGGAPIVFDGDEELVLCIVRKERVGDEEFPTELWIFDGSRPENGPVCKLSHDAFRFSPIHTLWMNEIKPYSGDYQIDLEEDLKDPLSYHPEEVQRYFKEVIFPKMRKGSSRKSSA